MLRLCELDEKIRSDEKLGIFAADGRKIEDRDGKCILLNKWHVSIPELKVRAYGGTLFWTDARSELMKKDRNAYAITGEDGNVRYWQIGSFMEAVQTYAESIAKLGMSEKDIRNLECIICEEETAGKEPSGCRQSELFVLTPQMIDLCCAVFTKDEKPLRIAAKALKLPSAGNTRLSAEDRKKAAEALDLLPKAMHAIMENRTFEPGTYCVPGEEIQ